MHLLDVLVLPSRRVGMWAEQFGRVLVEAMAARKIVIGSNSGAIPEVIGDAGFVFEENNSRDLNAKLVTALGLSGSELVGLQVKAFERATVTYSWQRFASRSLEAMNAVLERSTP
jgi:glycosyltransferase involved in cell wall biosynthesis